MATPTKPAAFWSVTIAAGVNDKINFKVGAGAQETATIAPATYYSILSLKTAIIAALNAIHNITWAITISATGIITVSAASTFQLLFSTGTNAAASPRDILGFGTVDTALAVSAAAANQHQNGWYAQDPPVDDPGDLPLFDRAQTVALSGRGKTIEYGTRKLRVVIFDFVPEAKMFTALEGASLNQALQRLYTVGFARIRWWDDATTVNGSDLGNAGVADYFMDIDSAKEFPRARISPGLAQYSITVRLRAYV